ncbi:MAG TPA: trigger factor family protein, partial [Lacipirellulaceae bacterium]|nr:trigger factor family protein [Lacipirellulaceae bacterium]
MAFERLRDEMMPEAMPSAKVADENDGKEEEKEPQKLDLEVQVESPSACERHVTVTISRADIDRYFDDAFGEMMPTAAVPGFRIGRAPRKVVEHRFRDEVSEQVKSSLLLDSLEQISDEERFTAISEPDFDLEAVEVPKEGPMTFEFTIEVRPEFDLPQWKGLKLNRPVHEFTDADVDEQLEQMLARYGQLVPYDGAAADGDYVSVNIISAADGRQVARENEAVMRILPTLSFRDARLDGFDRLM